MALSSKMLAWADAWLETRNKTEAARRAAYDGDDATLASIGWQNFRKPEIQEYIRQKLDEKGMPGEEVLARYAEMARAEYSAYIQRNGKVNISKLVKDGKAHLIKKIKPNQYGIEIEFYDAKAALDSLAKYHGLLVDRVDVTWRDKLPADKNPDEVKRQFVGLMKLAAKKDVES